MRIVVAFVVATLATAWMAYEFWDSWHQVPDGLYYISDQPTSTSITTIYGKSIYLGAECPGPIMKAEFHPTEVIDGNKYVFRLYFDRPARLQDEHVALCLRGRAVELGMIGGLNCTDSFEWTVISDRMFMTKMGAYFGITPWYWYAITDFIKNYTSTEEDWLFVGAFVALVCWLGSKASIWERMLRAQQTPQEQMSAAW